jgi:hypothetical protein
MDKDLYKILKSDKKFSEQIGFFNQIYHKLNNWNVNIKNQLRIDSHLIINSLKYK